MSPYANRYHCGTCGEYVKREDTHTVPGSTRLYHDYCNKGVKTRARKAVFKPRTGNSRPRT